MLVHDGSIFRVLRFIANVLFWHRFMVSRKFDMFHISNNTTSPNVFFLFFVFTLLNIIIWCTVYYVYSTDINGYCIYIKRVQSGLNLQIGSIIYLKFIKQHTINELKLFTNSVWIMVQYEIDYAPIFHPFSFCFKM